MTGRTVHDALGHRLVELRTRIRAFRGHGALRELARQMECLLDDMIHLARESPAITPLAKAVEDLEIDLSRRSAGFVGLHEPPRVCADHNTAAPDPNDGRLPRGEDGWNPTPPDVPAQEEDDHDDFQ